MLHLAERLFLDLRAETVVMPVLAHLGVKEVLIDRRQFFMQRFVQRSMTLGLPFMFMLHLPLREYTPDL
jgi:hypothetical protein